MAICMQDKRALPVLTISCSPSPGMPQPCRGPRSHITLRPSALAPPRLQQSQAPAPQNSALPGPSFCQARPTCGPISWTQPWPVPVEAPGDLWLGLLWCPWLGYWDWAPVPWPSALVAVLYTALSS